MQFRDRKDIGCISYHNPFPARCNNRGNLGLSGFYQYIQHISCFRGNFLYMDLATGLGRYLHHTSIYANAGSTQWDNFGNSNQFVRSKCCKYFGCISDSTPAQPGTITGATPVCQGSSNTYSISAVSGATSNTWTLPSGWSGSSTTTQ